MNRNRIAEEYLAVADEVFGRLWFDVEKLAKEIAGRLKKGAKLMICGNGGSAADAQHVAGEMVNKFLRDRRPYAALALSTDTSVITSIGNDYRYGLVFEKQVRALGRKGDVLLAISTSGKSESVWRAVAAARRMGLLTVGLTGGRGGRLAGMVDRPVVVSSSSCTPRIQEGHQLIIHALCQRVEELLK